MAPRGRRGKGGKFIGTGPNCNCVSRLPAAAGVLSG